MAGIADSTAFKVIVPVMQTLICAGALGAFTYVNSTLTSLQAQLSNYQTNQALALQRLESLERRADANDKIVDTLRSTSQGQGYQIAAILESIKNGVLSGRPK